MAFRVNYFKLKYLTLKLLDRVNPAAFQARRGRVLWLWRTTLFPLGALA
jgi:hypothetical protein